LCKRNGRSPAGWARFARGDHFGVGNRFAWCSLGLSKKICVDQREDHAKRYTVRSTLGNDGISEGEAAGAGG